MKSIWLDQTGLLKNTTWAILSPDGQEKLTKAGRGPFHEYRNASDMASGMQEIAARYQADDGKAGSDTQLPFAESVDIGLNISAADNIPMLVLVSADEEKAKALEQTLLPLAWQDAAIIGQYNFAKASSAKELSMLTGISGDIEKVDSLLIVEPGQFGLSGKVLKQLDAQTSVEDLKAALLAGVADCERLVKSHDSHVKLGIKLGIEWESEIPETDVQALDAKKRMRGDK